MGDTAIPIRDPIAGLNSILDLYSGKTTKTVTDPETTTSTTRSNMTAEQLQSQIDMAMAPLNVASHGAGLSTYSDTNLALGRAQVAGDILAKNAGNTTTQTSSGRTTTQSTPGALSSSRIGDTLSSLAVTQLGAPILKKLGQSSALQGLQDTISNTGSNMLDSILGTSSPMESVGRVNSSGATDTISAGIDALGNTDLTDAITTGTTAVSAAGGSGLLDTLSSGASDAIDWLKNLFAEGGMVRKGYAEGGYAEAAQDIGGDDGYATGGYIDRPAKSSNLVAQSMVDPVLQANGAISPVSATVGSSAQDQLLAYVASSGSGSKKQSVDPTTGAPLPAGVAENIAAIPGPQIGMSNAAMTALGLAGPVGALTSFAISKLLDIPTVQSQVASYASDVAAVTRDGGPQNFDHGTGEVGTKDPGGFGTMGGGGDAEGGVRSASGGKISGPGTGTSDSIPAKLSDGEYVIDAKTVDALGPDFFQKLQAMFNPDAIASQAAKGRI
jgi:hypothetical protein